MTTQLYLKDTYLLEFEGTILYKGEDERGVYIILNQTAFYPQGGGQPSDQGLIKNDIFKANIISVRQSQDEIRHYINLPIDEISISSQVNCIIDKERRILNSRYHTASHLLSNVVEEIYPLLKAVKGHSFPKEAYVDFQGNEIIDANKIQIAIMEVITKNDKTTMFEIDPNSFEQQFYKLPYAIPENKKFRAIQIGDMPPIPCGGTHLSSISEVGQFTIRKTKVKDNTSSIFYELV